MTFREKLADWLTKGEYSKRKIDADLNFQGMIRNTKAKQVYYSALFYIAHQDTPKSNATVKRMVTKAKEAMDHAGII